MARTTMADLITRLRRLINDSGTSQTWTDDELQDFLDARRLDVRRARLRPETTWAAGTVTYTDYYADYGDWESDAVLEDADGDDLTPSSSDWLTGHWTFADQDPPVFITGKSYDLYAAAADVLEAWAAKVALEFDFDADGGRFRRSQKREALLELAKRYRRRSRPQVAVMVRNDV
ncbi:MAG: hypothetical protein GXP39_07950 [Chloroflexi bacterium]|nr:hypothetical protein [Chloroflexota bacterium]